MQLQCANDALLFEPWIRGVKPECAYGSPAEMNSLLTVSGGVIPPYNIPNFVDQLSLQKSSGFVASNGSAFGKQIFFVTGFAHLRNSENM